MIETFEVINEKDVQNFNTKIGKIGITVEHMPYTKQKAHPILRTCFTNELPDGIPFYQ